jgi:hypothetical protein
MNSSLSRILILAFTAVLCLSSFSVRYPEKAVLLVNYKIQESLEIQESAQVFLKGHPKKQKVSPNSSSNEPKLDSFASAALMHSIVGICIPFFGIPLMILGLIFAIVSLKRINKNPEKFKGKGFAMVAIALAIIGLLIYLLLGIFLIYLMNNPIW